MSMCGVYMANAHLNPTSLIKRSDDCIQMNENIQNCSRNASALQDESVLTCRSIIVRLNKQQLDRSLFIILILFVFVYSYIFW